MDSFRNGLFDFEDVELTLTGIFFARNVGKKNFFFKFFYPPKCKNKNLGGDFLTPKWGMIILKRSEKRQGIFFAPETFLSESPYLQEKQKTILQKTFGPPTGQTIKARSMNPIFLEAELNNDYFLYITNFDPIDRYLRKSKKQFLQKLSGPLAARPVNLDRNESAYLKRNNISNIFYSRVNFD